MAAKAHNLAFIADTRLCQMNARNALTLDVGPPLKPYFLYTEEELEELVRFNNMVRELRPIPLFVRREINVEHMMLKDVEKKEKEVWKKKE